MSIYRVSSSTHVLFIEFLVAYMFYLQSFQQHTCSIYRVSSSKHVLLIEFFEYNTCSIFSVSTSIHLHVLILNYLKQFQQLLVLVQLLIITPIVHKPIILVINIHQIKLLVLRLRNSQYLICCLFRDSPHLFIVFLYIVTEVILCKG